MFSAKANKLFSEGCLDFLRENPVICQNIELNFGIESMVNPHTGKITVGLSHRKNWIAHELGHILLSPDEKLILPDFGNPIAKKYHFEDIMVELSVFRVELCLMKLFNQTTLVNESSKLVEKVTLENNETLIDPTDEKILILKEKTKEVFLSKITFGEQYKYVDQINDKMKEISSSHPLSIHDHFKFSLVRKEKDLISYPTLQTLEEYELIRAS